MMRKSMFYLVYDYEYFIGRSGLYASRAKLDNQAFSFIDLSVKFGKNLNLNKLLSKNSLSKRFLAFKKMLTFHISLFFKKILFLKKQTRQTIMIVD